MFYIEGVSKTMVTLIQTVYQFLWGDLITLPLPGGAGISFSLLVLLLIPDVYKRQIIYWNTEKIYVLYRRSV